MTVLVVVLAALVVVLVAVLAYRSRTPQALRRPYGGRRILTILLAFAILPVIGIALVHSYTALLIGGFFLGAAGSSFAVVRVLIEDLIRPTRGSTYTPQSI